MAGRKPQNWGYDDDDEETYRETRVDENGIKQKIRTYTDDTGQRVKEVTTIKVITKKTKVPKRIHERTLWKGEPFGEAIRETRDGEAKDEVRIDDPKTVEDEEAAADANVVRGLSNAMANLQKRRAGLLGSSSMPPPPEDDEPDDRGRGGGDKYVPPGGRGGRPDRNDEHTIRVSHLSADATDQDVRALFEPCGPVARVFIAKHKETNQSRGFAFVTFHYRQDAETAMQKLDRYPYDHQILELEWAKPQQKQEGGGEGLSSGFVSGYGKALAQDTHLAYSTASNLTR